MNTRTLPHDAYITAVCDALTADGLKPAESWTSDAETKGRYCYLNAVITLDPSGTADAFAEDIPAGTAWPHGLILRWEWHTGAEDDGPEKGPYWEFAALKEHGECRYPPVFLPVDGYASPAAIAAAARHVVDHRIKIDPFEIGGIKWNGGIVGDSWEQADELEAACEAWGTAEAATSA